MKRSITFAICATVCGVLVIMYMLGFRITYNPSIETSWDAVSACASWAAVVSSIGAIYVAIQIPKVIAERQDKIALFEKRFELYNVLRKCGTFSLLIQNSTQKTEVQIYFITVFGNEMLADMSKETLDRETIRLINQAQLIMEQGWFLFNFEIKNKLNAISSALLSTITVAEGGPNFGEARNKLYSLVADMEECIMPQIEQALRLG